MGILNQAGKSPAVRFIKLDSAGQHLPADAAEWDAILDLTTNLTWSVRETRSMSQSKATASVKKLTTCSFQDWRLPTRAELLTLVDDTRHSPAINTAFFPDCKSNWYWTSTPAAYSPGDYAWFVDFDGGDANWDFQDYSGFVRACRAGQS